MPGFLLHTGATVSCAHLGQAQPVAPDPRVRVTGQPVATLTSIYQVAGCSQVPPAPGPCATAQWILGALRVRASGVPVLVSSGQAVCVPTGGPLIALTTQVRVRGV